MPNGVVALFDTDITTRINDLWVLSERILGHHPEILAPFAHLTFHVAERYESPALATDLMQLAMKLEPITIQSSGLGIFTGPKPVLYISVVRTAALSAFHEEVWKIADKHAIETHDYYGPSRWVPHITLGHSGMYEGDLTKLINAFHKESFSWSIKLTHLSFTDDTPTQVHQLQRIIDLKGSY
ncbi:MAG: 2'-5' RNA ligase family protein [Anaerolineae bacterium]|nr:2'-5' RNA ligase family protein [Anaerolineae bacterium]